jgi:ornithine cyclodeaminase
MLIVTREMLAALLKMRDVIAVVEEGFRALGEGRCRVPARRSLEIPERQAALFTMPAYQAQPAALGVKIVSVFPGNRQKNLDLVQAAYLLMDAQTGQPLALMDGTYLTGIRTAAASAVATRYLSRGAARRLTIFGAGLQARFHVEAMLAVRPIEKIKIVSRTKEKAVALKIYIKTKFNLAAELATPEAGIAEADIVCTCTTSSTPLFDGAQLPAGVHINAVGAYQPHTREVDDATIRRARVVADTYEGVLKEAGDLLIPLRNHTIGQEHVLAELSEVVLGTKQVREGDQDITLFKSVGFALEDLVTAKLAYDKATEQGIGLKIEL